jgi:hypothetical protein
LRGDGRWRYFEETWSGRGLDFVRLRRGEPLLLAEELRRDGRWHRDDRLFQEKMLGKDYTFVEVDEARVREGWMARPLRDGPLTDESADRPDPDEIARLTGVEERIAGIWRAVPTPPGATGIPDPTAPGTESDDMRP